MDPAARKARNESLFRDINANIAELVEHSPTVRSSSVAFVCECANIDCTVAIELTLDEFERVRAEPTHFAVAPGHVAESIERVVGEARGYVIVEKIGLAGAIAETTDPTS